MVLMAAKFTLAIALVIFLSCSLCLYSNWQQGQRTLELPSTSATTCGYEEHVHQTKDGRNYKTYTTTLKHKVEGKEFTTGHFIGDVGGLLMSQ